MVVDFAALKRNRAELFEKTQQKIVDMAKGGTFARDERYWQPVAGPEGNGSAVLRFLPPPIGEFDAFVRKWTHRFKGLGGWYIENCLTTLGQKDPVADFNHLLWGPGKDCDPAHKDQVSAQKRRLGFISNVLVIRHANKPEDEGKVFLFDYGSKIWNKINDKMNPPYEEVKKFNPFDPWDGANFFLRFKKNAAGFRNYDDSEFDAPSVLGDDDFIKAVWEKEYSLATEIAPDKFKSYKELEEKLNRVLTGESKKEGVTPTTTAAAPTERAQVAPTQSAAPASAPVEEEGDEAAFFRNLAK